MEFSKKLIIFDVLILIVYWIIFVPFAGNVNTPNSGWYSLGEYNSFPAFFLEYLTIFHHWFTAPSDFFNILQSSHDGITLPFAIVVAFGFGYLLVADYFMLKGNKKAELARKAYVYAFVFLMPLNYMLPGMDITSWSNFFVGAVTTVFKTWGVGGILYTLIVPFLPALIAWLQLGWHYKNNETKSTIFAIAYMVPMVVLTYTLAIPLFQISRYLYLVAVLIQAFITYYLIKKFTQRRSTK